MLYTVTHPVDTIKVRLQLQGELGKRAVEMPSSAASTPHTLKYNGFLRGMGTILKDEGINGLYKGFSASLLREASYSTIRMGLYEPIKDALHISSLSLPAMDKNGNPMPYREPLWKKIIAGGISGMVGAAIANPTDLIKVRMQAESGKITKSVFQITMDIIKAEGVKGLYRGVGPTTQRAIILTASQLAR